MNIKAPIRWILPAVLALAFFGCRRESSPSSSQELLQLPVIAALNAPPGTVVLAQGQLEPAAGVIPIVAPVGDRLESIDVDEGSPVTVGKELATLAGAALRQAELAVAETQLAEGKLQSTAQLATAKAKLEVARIGVTKNEMQLTEARATLQRASAEGGELDLLQRKAALATEKLNQLRVAAAEPDSRRLVNESVVQQQELVVEAALAELDAAQRNGQSAVEAASLLVEASKAELNAAELQIESTSALAPLGSLEKKVDLLRLQVSSSKLKSPINGVVVAIDMAPGQPTTGMPVMRLADTSKMICRVEVPLAEIARVSLQAPVKMVASGLSEPLSGKVASISNIIGPPRLPNPNPMAQVDWRSALIIVEIDPQDAPRAAKIIQGQVDVGILAGKE